MVVCHAPELKGYDQHVFTSMLIAAAQVDEGDIEVVNIRETDSRLGPLVFSLVGLGIGTLVVTAIFWWLTRPRPADQPDPNSPIGGTHG